jgi:hypothetical protein
MAPFVTACGNLSNSSTGWPARLVAVDGGSEAATATLRDDLSDLSAAAGRQLFFEGETMESRPILKITIRRVPDWRDAPRRAGYATMAGDTCLVELADRLFGTHRDFRKTVVWHELGHCAGLDHDDETGEIMSATTSMFSSYDTVAIERFIESFERSAGLLLQTTRMAIGIMFPEE